MSEKPTVFEESVLDIFCDIVRVLESIDRRLAILTTPTFSINTSTGEVTVDKPCPTCGGSGEGTEDVHVAGGVYVKDNCPNCHGTGKREEGE